MQKRDLVRGDVVQLTGAKNPVFLNQLMVITEPKNWGAQGFVKGLEGRAVTIGGFAFYRATWEEMAYIGWAPVVEEPNYDDGGVVIGQLDNMGEE
jgi:hypothetical protein